MNDEFEAAGAIAYAKFLCEAGIQPEEMNEVYRNLFMAGFIFGADWCIKDVVRRIEEPA